MFPAFLLIAPVIGDAHPVAVADNAWCTSHGHPAFGSVVRAGGDFDGDGKLDFLVSDPMCAEVWVLSGSDGHVLRRIASPEPARGFGRDASLLGDLDKDKLCDFIVGSGSSESALVDDAQPQNALAVVVSGRTGATIRLVRGARTDGSFARFVEGLGDVDGDGVPDYAVAGAVEGALKSENVFATVLSGADGRVLSTVPGAPIIPSTFEGEIFAPLLEGDLCRLGDVDGDGHADFVAGVPMFSKDGSGTFELRVLSGRDGSRIATNTIPVAGITGPLRLAGGLRIDADSSPDFVAGVGWNCVRSISSRTGKSLFERRPAAGIDEEAMGDAVTLMPDVDGDGLAEIVVSASSEGVALGSVRVIGSRTGKEIWKTMGQDDGDLMTFHFGASLDVLGDIDGDGVADIVVGVDHSEYHGPGRVFVLSGKTGGVIGDFLRSGDSVLDRSHSGRAWRK